MGERCCKPDMTDGVGCIPPCASQLTRLVVGGLDVYATMGPHNLVDGIAHVEDLLDGPRPWASIA